MDRVSCVPAAEHEGITLPGPGTSRTRNILRLWRIASNFRSATSIACAINRGVNGATDGRRTVTHRRLLELSLLSVGDATPPTMPEKYGVCHWLMLPTVGSGEWCQLLADWWEQ